MKKTLLIAAALTCFSTTSVLANDTPSTNEMNTPEVRGSKTEKKVLQFEEAVVRKILTEEGYDELFILNQVLTLRQRDGRLQPLLDAYLKDRSLSEEFAANGTTIKMVMISQEKDFWNGLAYMEICIDDPGIAEHIKKTAQNIEEEKKRRGK